MPFKGPGNKILCAPHIFAPHRVSGATIYTGRMLLCAINTNVRYLKRTSRPANKLLMASFSPLSADEIFSITMCINTRCSSETEARPSKTFSSSDRTPDGAGLVPWPFWRPDTENLGGPHDHLLPLADPEQLCATTLRRRPPC